MRRHAADRRTASPRPEIARRESACARSRDDLKTWTEERNARLEQMQAAVDALSIRSYALRNECMMQAKRLAAAAALASRNGRRNGKPSPLGGAEQASPEALVLSATFRALMLESRTDVTAALARVKLWCGPGPGCLPAAGVTFMVGPCHRSHSVPMSFHGEPCPLRQHASRPNERVRLTCCSGCPMTARASSHGAWRAETGRR
jgi:hypothetical protein